MGDNYWAAITIGGDVPRWLVPKVREMLGAEFRAEWDFEESFEQGVCFRASDGEARNGRFSELEAFLITHRIHFDRECAGYCEYDPGLVEYRGEDEIPDAYLPEAALNHASEVVFTWQQVEGALTEELAKLRDSPETHLTYGSYFDDLIESLRLSMLGDSPTLKPLRWVDTCNACGKAMKDCGHVAAEVEKDPDEEK